MVQCDNKKKYVGEPSTHQLYNYIDDSNSNSNSASNHVNISLNMLNWGRRSCNGSVSHDNTSDGVDIMASNVSANTNTNKNKAKREI